MPPAHHPPPTRTSSVAFRLKMTRAGFCFRARTGRAAKLARLDGASPVRAQRRGCRQRENWSGVSEIDILPHPTATPVRAVRLDQAKGARRPWQLLCLREPRPPLLSAKSGCVSVRPMRRNRGVALGERVRTPSCRWSLSVVARLGRVSGRDSPVRAYYVGRCRRST